MLALFSLLSSTLWGTLYRTELWNNTASFVLQEIRSANDQFNADLLNTNYAIVNFSYQNDVRRILGTMEYASSADMLADRRTMENTLQTYTTILSSIQEIYVVTRAGFVYTRGSSNSHWSDDEVKDYYKIADSSGNTVCAMTENPHQEGISALELVMVKLIYPGKHSETLVVVPINDHVLLKPFLVKRDFRCRFVLYDPVSGRTLVKDNGEFPPAQDFPSRISQTGTDGNDYQLVKVKNSTYMVISYASSMTKWISTVWIPQDDLMRRYKRVSSLMNVASVLFLLMAAGIAYFLSGRLTRNIQKLTKSVETLDDDTSVSNLIIRSHDEVETLSIRFQKLLDHLHDQIEQIRRSEEEKKKLEIDALQAQINPHFLYNSLNTIRSLAQLKGMKNIEEVTDALSRIMETAMSRKNYMTLEEEQDYLNSYICMLEYRNARPIPFQTELDSSVRGCLILKLLIQPLVENSIKHGGILENPSGFVKVKIFPKDQFLTVQVIDNGKGFTEPQEREIQNRLHRSKGIGLYNVMQRIHLYYGDRYGLTLRSEPGKLTMVELRLPIIRGEDEHA